MADPFSLATGVLSLVAITLKVISSVSKMLNKTIAAHRVADEELERLRCNLEELQERMESNYGKLEALASDTKDRGFKKVLQSDAGQAAVVRLCQALKETHDTLKRLIDQTESEEAILHANVLPSKKGSLAFVRAVLKYNMSPQTIHEVVSNLRQMQREIQDCRSNLETSFKNVDDLHDLFHRQVERFSICSGLSTSTTLPIRVQLVNWLGNFGGRELSQRNQNGSKPLHTLLHADQDEDGDTSSDESLHDPTPPPLPSRPLPITVPNTVPPHLKGFETPARVKAAQQRVPPPHPKSDTDPDGRNVIPYFVPPKVGPRNPQSGSDTRRPYTSGHFRPYVPMHPPHTRPQSDWVKHQQLFAVKLHELQTQVAALEERLNKALGSAKNNEEIQKAMKKYLNRMKDLWRDRGGELDELEKPDNDDKTNPASPPVPSRPMLTTIPLIGTNAHMRGAHKVSFDAPHRPEHDSSAAAATPRTHSHHRRWTNPEGNTLVDPSTESTRYGVIGKMTAGKNNVQPEPQFPGYRENFTARANALRAQEEAEVRERGRQEDSMLRRGGSLDLRRQRHSSSRGSPCKSPESSAARVERTQQWARSPPLNNEEAKEAKDPWCYRRGELERSDNDDENPAPPPVPSRSMLTTMPLTTIDPVARVERTQRPPQNTNSDIGTGGSNVNHYFDPQPAREPFTSSHRQPPVPTPPITTWTDWAKQQPPFAVKLHEWQAQVAAVEGELNRTLGDAKNNEEIEKAMEKYHNRMKDLLRDRGGELDELEQSDNDDETNPAPPPFSSLAYYYAQDRPYCTRGKDAAMDAALEHESRYRYRWQ